MNKSNQLDSLIQQRTYLRNKRDYLKRQVNQFEQDLDTTLSQLYQVDTELQQLRIQQAKERNR